MDNTDRKEPAMKNQVNYNCTECGKNQTVPPGEAVPECCGKPMKAAEPLPVCELSASAEHSRMQDDSAPCDDGRAGGNS